MARRDSYEEEEEGGDDPADPDESDMDEDDEDGPALVECPYCGSEILEDAERCPRCGNFISEEDAPRRKPAWIVVSAVLLVVAIVVSWVFWGR
jgi:predicted nucleic acid-binding Zn ribbon protein